MSLMDKFLDVMRLNGDDDDDYEFANEEYLDDDDYEEPKQKAVRRENKVEVKEEKKPVSKLTPISRSQKKQVSTAKKIFSL